VGYINVLFSVPAEQIRAIQDDPNRLLHPASVSPVGHVWWPAEEAEPLLDLIGEVLDGGELLSPAYRHPLRPPVYHDPRRVRDLAEQLDRAWQQPYAAPYRVEAGGMVRSGFEEILRLFRGASGRGECVVSVLLPPTGVEGYDWVKMPFAVIPASGASEAVGSAPVPRASLSSWLGYSAVGSAAGLAVLGAVGVCLWRYGRLTTRSSGPADLHR
jgi:hypothetical protein